MAGEVPQALYDKAAQQGSVRVAAPAAEVGEVDVSATIFLQTLPATEPVPRIEDYQLKQP